jgi:ADP-ribose pyrophosphatase YjhB (NUDIX family)
MENIAKDKIVCSGALIYSISTSRVLLIQKAAGKHQGSWGLVGGTNLIHENPWQGLHREIEEEIGFFPEFIKVLPLEKFVSNDSIFNFHTYFCLVENEFIPILSDEHCGWAWSTINSAPKPLHHGLRTSFSNKIIKAKLQTIFELCTIINASE